MTSFMESDISIENCKSSFWEAARNFLKRKPVVALIRMSGNVGRGRGAISFEAYESIIEKAFKLSGVKAVILVVNSPGGAPAQCEMIADQIIRLSKEHEIPVYSFAEDVAASAGYWILASGTEIYATAASIVGSIGVMYAGFGFVDAIKKLGIERRTYYEGKNKMILDPFKPEKTEDVAVLSRMQRDLHENFKNFIIRRRAGKLCQETDDIFSGMFWTGGMALELGLIDGINNYNRFIVEKFGKNAKVVPIKRDAPWWTRGLPINVNLEDISNKIREILSFARNGI